MRTTVIICELNPLHLGHKYLLDTAHKDADCIIAIMSGSFVQRGEPAFLDKYTRAEIAVRAGADLVLELPFPWCSASAEFFAAAGTAVAEKAGAEKLAFGIGCKDSSILSRAADFFLDPAVTEEIKVMSDECPSTGIAAVREKCLKSNLGTAAEEILRTPNDILAIEYLRQIKLHGYSIIPQMIHRLTDEDNPRFCGATHIRSLLRDKGLSGAVEHLPEFVSPYISEAMTTGTYASSDALCQIAFQALRTDFLPDPSPIAEGEGGLLDRIRAAASKSTSGAEMLEAAATKRYTNARIRRVLLYYLLQVSPDILRESPTVTTLLAASEKGRAYLSVIRKNPGIRIITKPADYRSLTPDEARHYRYTMEADSLYTLCRSQTLPADYFLKEHPRFPRT